MSGILQTIVTATLVIVAIVALEWTIRRSKPLALTNTTGTIRPERISAWVTVIVGAVIFGVSLDLLIDRDGGSGAAIAAAVGAAIAGFTLPSVTMQHAVSWDEGGIRGPSRMFGLTLGTSRTEIRWSDIVTIGKTATGYWFVAAEDGRRVYWSFLSRGCGVLTRAIAQNCPGVPLPFGM